MYPKLLQYIILPIGSWFFGGNFSKNLRKWKAYDSLSEEALLKLQQKGLDDMLAYALEHVPFYRGLGITASTPLSEWPIITKEILREQTEELISEEYDKTKLIANHSSGSSGVQSFTYMTAEERNHIRAIQTHWWEWGGFRPGERMLQTGMSPKRGFVKTLKDFFFRVYYMDAFTLNDSNIEFALSKFKPSAVQHIAGYPSAINEIAKYLIKNGRTLPFCSLNSLGDKLFPQFRRNFKEAFEDPVIVNTYGCAEGYMVGCQLDLDAYYIMSPHVYIEIVDASGQPVPPGERGHILITGLSNFAMPLIRYKVGDLGVLMPPENYPKERKFAYPLLQELTGRETDVVTTPTGITLIVHSFTGIFEYYTEIKQFKIIQISEDTIVVEYITDSGEDLAAETLSELYQKLTHLSENSLQITFKKVDFIAPSPSGKPQIVASLIR